MKLVQNVFMTLHQLSNKKNLTVLGIMNGTSLDGVDFVLVKIQKPKNKNNYPKISYLAEQAFAFPKDLRLRLIAAARHDLKVNDLSLLHHELGRFYAKCYSKLKPKMKNADLIGLHGQTVFHQAPMATLQIGESSYLADISKKPVIADFRVSDLSLGGQGAPIATLFHQVAFGSPKETISVHNLGGISNLTLISQKGVELAFDTGPANILMDMLMQKISAGKSEFDKNGALAKKGTVDLEILGELLSHKYFQSKPPKSCGREEFGEVLFAKFLKAAKGLPNADMMATLSDFTAWTIALSYKKFIKKLPSKIIFCGGGANNTNLLERIQILLPECQVLTSEDLGWPASSIEGAAFALLAAYKIWDMPSNLPKTTGAKRPVSMGKITTMY